MIKEQAANAARLEAARLRQLEEVVVVAEPEGVATKGAPSMRWTDTQLARMEEVVAINEDNEEVEDDEAEIGEGFPSRLAWLHVLLDPALLCVELRRHRFQAMVSAAMGCLPLLGWHTA